eukprot:1158547-Pelagomonas_calceolata.AAC.6
MVFQISGGNERFALRWEGINSMALVTFGYMDYETFTNQVAGAALLMPFLACQCWGSCQFLACWGSSALKLQASLNRNNGAQGVMQWKYYAAQGIMQWKYCSSGVTQWKYCTSGYNAMEIICSLGQVLHHPPMVEWARFLSVCVLLALQVLVAGVQSSLVSDVQLSGIWCHLYSIVWIMSWTARFIGRECNPLYLFCAAIFWLAVAILGTVAMNILIAIVGDAYTEAKDKEGPVEVAWHDHSNSCMLPQTYRESHAAQRRHIRSCNRHSSEELA